MKDLTAWLDHLSATTAIPLCGNSANSAASKLREYTQEKKQPAISFLQAIRVLDPTQLPAIDIGCYATLENALHLPVSCKDEWPIYLALAVDIEAHKQNLLQFWQAVSKRVPNLASRAVLLLQLPINNADAERSFSAFNMLHTPQRQNLTERNVEGLLKLYFNQESH